MVLQDRWSLLAVVFQDRFHCTCIVTNPFDLQVGAGVNVQLVPVGEIALGAFLIPLHVGVVTSEFCLFVYLGHGLLSLGYASWEWLGRS